jgi:hypothetical protein
MRGKGEQKKEKGLTKEPTDGGRGDSRAASAAVLSPLETILLISACCWREFRAGARRCVLPEGRKSKPGFVLSRSMARSYSAKAPAICIIIRPAGVVVSIASVRLRKPDLASSAVP